MQNNLIEYKKRSLAAELLTFISQNIDPEASDFTLGVITNLIREISNTYYTEDYKKLYISKEDYVYLDLLSECIECKKYIQAESLSKDKLEVTVYYGFMDRHFSLLN